MEFWLTIKDFPDYEASNLGRIRNAKTGRIMRTNVNSSGYETVCLRKNKTQYTKRVHRLIADTFFDGNHDCLDINHIDGDKLNNHISNLEVCTRSENIRHAFEHGLKTPSRQIKVRVIETGKIYNSIRDCGRDLRCNQSDICKCLKGVHDHVQGYHFEKI